MNQTESKTTEVRYEITQAACQLIYLTEKQECSTSGKNICITCPSFGGYLAGDHPNDFKGLGHTICVLLWILTVIVGAFGTISNILIIIILNRKKQRRAFDTLLKGLAGFDALFCVSSVCTSTGAIAYTQNWSRGYTTWHAFFAGLNIALVVGSGSSFTIVLISIERYLVIAHPVKLGSWFSKRKNRVLVSLIAVWGFLLGIPRFTSYYVERNPVGTHFPSLEGVEYIIEASRVEHFWYGTLGGLNDLIDFIIPVPVLLIFNSLVYFHVRKADLRREELSSSFKRDVHNARMFQMVVVVLLICHIFPAVHYVLLYGGRIYAETQSGSLLIFIINSSINMPIYYFRDSSFRREAKSFASKYFSVSKTGDDSREKMSVTGESALAVESV